MSLVRASRTALTSLRERPVAVERLLRTSDLLGALTVTLPADAAFAMLATPPCEVFVGIGSNRLRPSAGKPADRRQIRSILREIATGVCKKQWGFWMIGGFFQ